MLPIYSIYSEPSGYVGPKVLRRGNTEVFVLDFVDIVSV